MEHSTSPTAKRAKAATAGLINALTLASALLWPLQSARAQTAALIPNASQQYLNSNGQPLAGGSVYYYVPNTTTPKTTWSDPFQATPDSSPVTLDAGGFPPGNGGTFGQGNYRQIVKDAQGNLIWDGFTSAYGSSSPSGATGTDTAPVGTILPWAGFNFNVPTNWALTYGQALSRTTYAQLETAITISTTTGNCISSSTTVSGFSDTSQIAVGSPIEASCLPTSNTVASVVNSTTITVATAATATGTFTVTVFPWGNGDGVSTFNLPDLRGRVPPGADCMGGTCAGQLTSAFYGAAPGAPGRPGGSQSKTLTLAQLPTGITSAGTASVSGTTTDYPNGNNTLQMIATGASGWALVPVPSTGSFYTPYLVGGSGAPATVTSFSGTNSLSGTSSVTSSNTSGSAFGVVPPALTVNYIIKIAPNTTGAGGVVSLGGMFGDIVCASTLTCAPVGSPSVNTIGCTTATISQLGCVEPDNTTITISSGVLSAVGAAQALFSGTTIVHGGPGVLQNAVSGGTLSSSLTLPNGLALQTPASLTLTNATGLPVAGGGTGGASWTANLPLLGNGTGTLLQGTLTGNTTKFATSSGTLITGDCVQIDSHGNFIDSGSSGCGGGASLPVYQIFSAPGAVTTLTLTNTPLPSSAGLVSITFDGVLQVRSTWSINTGTGVITFNSAIPINVQQVEVDWLSASVFSGVTSVFGRTGTVTAANGDYNSGQITYTPQGTGAVATTAAAEFNRVIWVNDYGAVCNGVTDDHAAFQAAINQGQASNNPVRFVGSCAIASTLNITSGLDFGGTMDGAQLIPAVGINVINGASTGALILHDFSILYPSAASTSTAAITLAGIGSTGQSSSRIFNVTISNAFVGINNLSCVYCVFSNNSINAGATGGIGISMADTINADGGDNLITGNLIQAGAGGIGVKWVSGGGINIVKNKILSATMQIGIAIELASGAVTSDAQIIGNSIEGFQATSSVCINVTRQGSTGSFGGVHITDNECSSMYLGVYIPTDANGTWLSAVVIQGNILQLNTTAGATGILIDTTATATIANNLTVAGPGSSQRAIYVGTTGLTSTNCSVGPNPYSGTFIGSVTSSCTAIAPN